MRDARRKAIEHLVGEYKQRKISLKDHLPNMNRSKSQALEHYIAKTNKKKLPKPEMHEKDKSPYKKLSIEEYEAKYK